MRHYGQGLQGRLRLHNCWDLVDRLLAHQRRLDRICRRRLLWEDNRGNLVNSFLGFVGFHGGRLDRHFVRQLIGDETLLGLVVHRLVFHWKLICDLARHKICLDDFLLHRLVLMDFDLLHLVLMYLFGRRADFALLKDLALLDVVNLFWHLICNLAGLRPGRFVAFVFDTILVSLVFLW